MLYKTLALIVVVATGMLLAACTGDTGNGEQPANPNIANPASVYCEEQGGEIEIRTDATAGEYGVCIFEDGSECEEWAFYRDECKPGDFETAPSPVPAP